VSHSRKILSQAGVSLADVYDIEGSVVGLEELDVENIKGVHELGAQIHSERLLVFGLDANSGLVAQSTNWSISLGGFPDSINRILSICFIADTAARVDFCNLNILDGGSLQGHPIAAWDSNVDVEQQVRWLNPTIATETLLMPTRQIAGGLPTILARTGASEVMPTLEFRGRTLGFGAGTVRTRALIQVARPDRGNPAPGEPSSHGLPIPSW